MVGMMQKSPFVALLILIGWSDDLLERFVFDNIYHHKITLSNILKIIKQCMLVSTEKLKVSFNTFVVAFSEEGHGRIYGMSYIITADFS